MLVGVGVVLAAGLLGTGFLVGRQSSVPIAQTTAATPPPLAVEQPADDSLDARVQALESRVQQVKQAQGPRLVAPPVAASSSPTFPGPSASAGDVALRQEYFRQVDEVVGGAQAIADPKPFAARLLEQGMRSGTQLDIVLARTSLARAGLRKVKPPESCLEHHALLTAQLEGAAVLLEEVQTANATGDTEALKTLAAQAEESQTGARRLQEVDRALRP